MDTWYIFKKVNILYKKAYLIYRPMYFVFKNISERKRINLIKSMIKPGMCVLDIGANIGFYSRIFSSSVGNNGIVYTFEPDKTNFSKLTETTKNTTNVVAINAAVGSYTGFIDLFISNDMNIDHHTYNDGENRKCKKVPCISIDDFIVDKQCPSLVKIDIQGFDYFALKGMLKTISRTSELIIFGEFWPYGLNKAGVSPKLYYNLLVENGMQVTFFDKTKNAQQMEEMVQNKYYYTDFIAIKNIG